MPCTKLLGFAFTIGIRYYAWGVLDIYVGGIYLLNRELNTVCSTFIVHKIIS